MGVFSKDNVTTIGTAGAAQFDAKINSLIDYWQSKREGSDVPFRNAIDPRGISDLLSNAFVAERIAPGLARFRIAGAHLADLMGMDVRGMPLSCLISPKSRDRLAKGIAGVLDAPSIARLTLEIPAGFGRPATSAALVLLPLRSDLGDVSRVLGCLVSDGPAGRTPSRFDITHVAIERVTEASQPPAPQTKTAPQHPSERSYLRLVT